MPTNTTTAMLLSKFVLVLFLFLNLAPHWALFQCCWLWAVPLWVWTDGVWSLWWRKMDTNWTMKQWYFRFNIKRWRLKILDMVPYHHFILSPDTPTSHPSMLLELTRNESVVVCIENHIMSVWWWTAVTIKQNVMFMQHFTASLQPVFHSLTLDMP